MQRTIEQELADRGSGLFQTVGDSMEPLLHHRKSTVLIEKARGELARGDAALFRRPTGEYVLHRVVKVRDTDYLIAGDNRLYREPVPKAWVIGVMTGFYPDESERFISCGGEEYRKYLHSLRWRRFGLWWRLLPLRAGKKIQKLLQKPNR